MGWILVADAPPGPGRGCLARGDLDKPELAQAVALLKDAAASLRQTLPRARALAVEAPRAKEPAPPQRAPPAAPPLDAQQPALPGEEWEPTFDAQAALRDRLQRAFAWKQVPAANGAPARPAKPERAAEALRWRECGRTDGEDHGGAAVNALAYVPLLPDLSSGDGHGGWLVSASPGLLNLWECNMGASEQPLLLMHSQATDTDAASLAVERGTRLLLAAARDTRPPSAECACVHSMSADPGMLAPRFKIALPMPYQPPLGPGGRAKERQALQVASLHPLGGPLLGCLAISHGKKVSIFSLGGYQASGGWRLAEQPPTAPRASWAAAGCLVTGLHASAYGLDLFTGASDGGVARWDLKTKPRSPAAKLEGLSGAVSGLAQIDMHRLLAASRACASGQGLLATWDLRQAHTPLATFRCPDGSGVTSLAVSPEERTAAFASAAGQIYSLATGGEEEGRLKVVCGRLPRPAAALAWCARTQQLAAAVGPSLAVFRRVRADA